MSRIALVRFLVKTTVNEQSDTGSLHCEEENQLM
jgi:hypothetical protein